MEQQLESAPAGLRATIHVTRKDTGKVETYDLIQIPEPTKQLQGENDGSHAHNNG
mgnify:CR=1 FL=1